MKKVMANLNHYGILLLFVLFTFAGVATYFLFGEESRVWKIWQVVDTSFAIALGVLAFLGYREYMKSKDEINIVFEVEEKNHPCTG